MNKSDVKTAISNFNKNKEIKQHPTIIQVVKPIKKVGRPSTKLPRETYVRISAKILDSTKTKLKVALYTSLKSKYKTQDELVNDAILAFVDQNAWTAPG